MFTQKPIGRLFILGWKIRKNCLTLYVFECVRPPPPFVKHLLLHFQKTKLSFGENTKYRECVDVVVAK